MCPNPQEIAYLVTYTEKIPKGTVMQIEKPLIIDRLHVSKVSSKLRISTVYNFAVIYP